MTFASPGVFLGNVSLTVRAGERVGVTGLRGSGATTLARIVAGATAPDVGQVRLGDRVLRPGDRAGALRAGIGYIPEDRQADGFVPLLGAAENIAMTITDRIARGGFISPRTREARAAPLARRLSLVSAGLGQPVRELSGGNQQKVTVARALASDPVLIVAITPTRGVDVASKELLLSELDRITGQTGASLLLASDELDDLVDLRPGGGARARRDLHRVHRAALRPRGADRGHRRDGGIMSDTKNNLAALAADVESALARRRSRSAAAISWIREAALLPVLAVLLVVGAILNSHFLTVSNMTGIGQQVSALGVVVVGESLILLIGGMDLSLESTYGLAPMLAAWLIVPVAAFGDGLLLNPYLGIVILLAVGAAAGLVNGLLIVKGRLNGFIVTLGMTILLAGIQDGIVKGQAPFNLPTAFGYLGTAAIGAVPVSFIVAAVIFTLTGLFLRYHRLGRAIYAVGGNREAARAAGIKVDQVRIGVYVAGSVLAAIGGLMEAGRVSSVAPTQGYGEGIIFSVFAAAVIGGVSLQGGRGNMVGAASGVILLGVVQNILDLENAPNYWIDAIDGGVILLALLLARVIGGESSAE